jgi:hypothetical protein
MVISPQAAPFPAQKRLAIWIKWLYDKIEYYEQMGGLA